MLYNKDFFINTDSAWYEKQMFGHDWTISIRRNPNRWTAGYWLINVYRDGKQIAALTDENRNIKPLSLLRWAIGYCRAHA